MSISIVNFFLESIAKTCFKLLNSFRYSFQILVGELHWIDFLTNQIHHRVFKGEIIFHIFHKMISFIFFHYVVKNSCSQSPQTQSLSSVLSKQISQDAVRLRRPISVQLSLRIVKSLHKRFFLGFLYYLLSGYFFSFDWHFESFLALRFSWVAFGILKSLCGCHIEHQEHN